MAPRKQNEQLLDEIQKANHVEEAQNNQRKHKMDSDDDVKLVDSQTSHAEERPALKKRGRKSRWEKLLEDVNNAKKSNPAEVEVAEAEEHKAANVFDYPTIFWKLARPKYGVFTFMCNDCRNENFKRGDKRFLLNTGSGQEKLEFTQTFCHDCAKLNFDCTDLIMKYQKKDDGPQKNGGRNTYFKTENNTPGFVGNKTNKFKVHLPKKLVFDGPGWMVGMSGIIYPNSWATVGTLERQYVVVHLRDGRKFRFRVPRGSFLSPQQLERGMHHGMIAEMERLLTRKRSIQYPDEGEILDMEVVEEEETGEAPNNRYARAYHDAQEHLGMACTTESNGISYSMFKTAYCLYVFQMTNAQEDSPGFELIKEGCTAVNIRFTEAVPNEGVTLIAYGEADGLILIDRNRSITSDLTV
ncbi:hypothetical protein niasHT_001437 [Heterodera trifolii]|uniref:Uncharacterized protein n=1 Tax=Heterodera trifolii TaxID=157864 RepID=A0ABD2LRH3_9BILA